MRRGLRRTLTVNSSKIKYQCAEVSELADEQDSGSCARLGRVSSSLIFRIEDVGLGRCLFY